MRVVESCAECLYDKQRHLSDGPSFLSEIEEIIRNGGTYLFVPSPCQPSVVQTEPSGCFTPMLTMLPS